MSAKKQKPEPMIPIGQVAFVISDDSVRQVMIHRWVTHSHSVSLKPQPGNPWYSDMNNDAEQLYEICWMNNDGDIEYDQRSVDDVYRTADRAFSAINARLSG